MSELRNELGEAAKARVEFLKWKLIGASALGATGLGLGGGTGAFAGNRAYLVLTLIPLMCFYADLLCRHMALRIHVIGQFLKICDADEQGLYERFVERTRHMGDDGKISVFAFDDAALMGSTVALSGLVAITGFVLGQLDEFGKEPLNFLGWPLPGARLEWLFALSGVLGSVLTIWNRHNYLQRVDLLRGLASNTLMEELRREAGGGLSKPPGGS